MTRAFQLLHVVVSAARTQAYRLGPLGQFGVALVCLSIFMLLAVESRFRSDMTSLDAQSRRVRRETPDNGISESRASLVTGEQNFPELKDMPGMILEVDRLVEENHLRVDAMRYTLTAATESSPAQYEMRFKACGNYSSLRVFVQAVLNTQPALAVRELRFQRSPDSPNQVEAMISLVVFLRPWIPA